MLWRIRRECYDLCRQGSGCARADFSEETYALDADIHACRGRFDRVRQPFAATARTDGTATTTSAACTNGDSATIFTVAANAPFI